MAQSTCCVVRSVDRGVSPGFCARRTDLPAVNFGPFIAYTNIDTESLNILREYINEIMK